MLNVIIIMHVNSLTFTLFPCYVVQVLTFFQNADWMLTIPCHVLKWAFSWKYSEHPDLFYVQQVDITISFYLCLSWNHMFQNPDLYIGIVHLNCSIIV